MRGLIQEPIDHLGGRVIHHRGKHLDLAKEIVVGHDRWDRHEQASGRCHERFGDPGRHRAKPAGSCLGNRLEGPDDPQDGPEEAHKGADIAEGVEIDGAPAEDRRDYSSADFLDRHTGEQVAQFHAQVTPDEFGRQLALAGEWYNWAFVNPEMNAGYGAHLVDTMVNEKYPEHLFYKRDDNNIGWKTTNVNKKPLLSALDMAIRDKELVINSAETVRELRSFIVKPDGKLEGGAGSKDDRVMSLAIAYRTLLTAPAGRFDHTENQKPVRYLPYKNIYFRRAVRTYAN